MFLDLAQLSAPIDSNYPCLELVFMVPKVFEPLKFDCIYFILHSALLLFHCFLKDNYHLSCNENNDCFNNHTICEGTNHLCVCSPGYSYNPGTKSCSNGRLTCENIMCYTFLKYSRYLAFSVKYQFLLRGMNTKISF